MINTHRHLCVGTCVADTRALARAAWEAGPRPKEEEEETQ